MKLTDNNANSLVIGESQGIGRFILNSTPFTVENIDQFKDNNPGSNGTSSRFRKCTDSDIDKLALGSKSLNTHKQTKWGIKVFRGK